MGKFACVDDPESYNNWDLGPCWFNSAVQVLSETPDELHCLVLQVMGVNGRWFNIITHSRTNIMIYCFQDSRQVGSIFNIARKAR